MSKIVRVLLVLALVGAMLGYFRNWYTVSRLDEEQHININVKIDRQRIREDLQRAHDRVNRVAGRKPADNDAPPAVEQNGYLPYGGR